MGKGSRLKLKSLTMAVLCGGLVLSGCEKKPSDAGPAAVAAATSKDPGSAVISAARKALSAEEQAKIPAMMAERAAELETELKRSLDHPDGSPYLAGFVNKNEDKIADLTKSIEQQTAAMADMLERSRSGDDSEMRSPSRTIFAGYIAEREARRAIMPKALAADPLVARAYAEWLKAANRSTSISQITRRFLEQPCLSDQSDVPTFNAKHTFRGGAVGMTEAQALKAACAANNGNVKIVSVSPGRTHQTPYTNSADHVQAQNTLAKPYRSGMKLCIGCLPSVDGGGTPNPSDRAELEISFLPTGQIYRLRRQEVFGQGGISAAAQGAAPRQRKGLLDTLQGQFGAPSFSYSNELYDMVAWRYSGNGNWAPLEPWYAVRTVTGAKLQYKADELIYAPAGYYSEAKLRKENPQSSYCMNLYFSYGDHLFWGKYLQDNPELREVMYRVEGKSFEQVGRELQNYKPPGYTNDCGTLIFAMLERTQEEQEKSSRARISSFKSVDGATQIANLQLDMLDAAAFERWRATEAQEIEAFIKMAKQAVAQRAATPTAAFKP